MHTMICTTSSIRACALLALLAVSAVHAQGNNNNNLNDLPTLTTNTQAAGATPTTSAATSPTSATDGSSTTQSSQTAQTTATSNAFTATFPDATTSTSTGGGGSPVVFTFSNIPTIAGAGIPSMVIPYTADAPFMQKSELPEGTVFIAVGAVLAFLGASVLLWRGMIAWSINRSVKRNSRAALGLGGSEKTTGWGRGGGGGPIGGGGKGAYYKEYEMGSTMSLDALNSNGKATRQPTFHDEGKRQSSAPPAGLFFSPTAQASRVNSVNLENHGSTYLPAGYYASPNSEAAGGRGSTVIGSNIAPYARNSAAMPSPPGSPVPGSRSTSNNYAAHTTPYMSRDGFRTTSREGLRAPPSRDGYNSQRNSSVLYNQASSSSLMVGTGGGAHGSSEYLGGQRAPSAVLDELFENHGNGPRERF